MKYEVSSQASQDLRRIWQYSLENWSLQQADAYIEMLLEHFEQLGDNPFLGKDRGYLIPSYRSLKAGSHLIFYRTYQNGGNVLIVRVLHQSMDSKRWISFG